MDARSSWVFVRTMHVRVPAISKDDSCDLPSNDDLHLYRCTYWLRDHRHRERRHTLQSTISSRSNMYHTMGKVSIEIEYYVQDPDKLLPSYIATTMMTVNHVVFWTMLERKINQDKHHKKSASSQQCVSSQCTITCANMQHLPTVCKDEPTRTDNKIRNARNKFTIMSVCYIIAAKNIQSVIAQHITYHSIYCYYYYYYLFTIYII